METIMFAVGALTMVLLAVASLAVYSTVMVLKLKKESYIDRTEIWRYMHDDHQIVFRKIEDIENNLRTEMRLGEQELNNKMDQLTSYTDRRFDKLIDTHLSVKETEKKSKQIING